MFNFNLGKNWQVRYEDLYIDKENYAIIKNKNDGWLNVESLPCDVRIPLIEQGTIDDPLVEDNCFKSQWIEDKSWWFRKVFDAEDDLLSCDNSELVIEGLDVKADIFLNDVYLGHHTSSMYPFRKDIRDYLVATNNILVIRLTSGLEYYNEMETSELKDYVSCEYKRRGVPRGDNRRVFLRKPQYVYGWDWTPRVATCGIMGNARIEAYREVAIRSIKFTTEQLSPNQANVSIEAEIDNIHPYSTVDMEIELDVCFEGGSVKTDKQEIFARSGTNYIKFNLIILNPKLWWPNGMGAQNLYTVKLMVNTKNGNTHSKEIKSGIRIIRLNTDKIDSKNRYFAFEINGVKTFCKGANWETPDAIYGRISNEKYETLVKEARDANFNMLRVNGCNAYESDYFYECCDRYGIMLWQDFAGFSCAAYPDHLDWFINTVEKELDYQTKRLRNHPCIVLWCGNNECIGLLLTYQKNSYWHGEKKPLYPAGTIIYNTSMPKVIKNNCPEIPYWNSSPYGGAENMDCTECGDSHYWDLYMHSDINKRIMPEEYDNVEGKFISEFGCVGPTKKSSLQRYFGNKKIDMYSDIWKHHTCTFEKGTTKAAIRKHYSNSDELSIDEYLLYGGLFQGSMLEYAIDSMRCAKNNSGALIWSFNDAWGEVGWSIIDYYLIRKIAYYFVKRAFENIRFVIKQKGKVIDISCLNNTPEMFDLDLEYGYITFEGNKQDTQISKVKIPAFTNSCKIACLTNNGYDPLRGIFYVKALNRPEIKPAIIRGANFKDMQLSTPKLTITDVKRCPGGISFTVSSDSYAHGVHFKLDDRISLSDEYFDLLPNESRRISVFYDNTFIGSNGVEAFYVKPIVEC